MSGDNIPNWKLLCTALIVSLGGSFQFGFQLTIPNPAENAFQNFVNASMKSMGWHPTSSTIDTIWGFVVSLCFVGAIFGSLGLKFTADLMGRKKALILFDIFILLLYGLAILSKFINSILLFALSRLFIGFFIGPILSLTPLLLTECSPIRCRGFISMATGLMVQLGLCIGAIVSMPEVFGTDSHWWLIYVCSGVILIIALIILPLIHESPIYLLTKNREKEAKKSILFYGWCSFSELENNFKEMKASLEGNTNSIGMLEVAKDRIALRGTIVGSLVAFAVGMSGVDVMVAYSVSILIECGVSRLVAQLVQAGVNGFSMVSIIFSSFIVDRFGRRPILLFTMLIICICDLGMVLLMLVYEQHKTTLIGIIFITVYIIFAFFFATGPQCLCFFMASEMVAPNARAAAQSWAAFLQMASGAIAVGAFLPLKNALTQPWAFFLLFALPMGILEVFFYFMLPETKNKNLNEVIEEIDKLPRITRQNIIKRNKFLKM